MERLLAVFCIFGLAFVSFAMETESMLELLDAMAWMHWNADIPPLDNGPVEVTLSLDLTSIREIDTDRGEVEIFAMLTHIWKNPTLSWLTESHVSPEAQAVSSIVIAINHLWSPDIVAYNPIHAPELLSPPLALVKKDGTVYYIPNQRIRFRCNLENLESSDGANCTLKYGSWTHNRNRIALKDNGVSMWNYVENPKVEILGVYSETEVKHNTCCPEPYPYVVFTLNIKERRHNLFDG